MKTTFVAGLGTGLQSVAREYAADPAVTGLLVLAANDGGADISTLDSLVQELSIPVFGGIFPGVLFEGDRHTDGAVVVALSVEPTVTVVTGLSDPETAIRPQLDASVATPGETTAFVFADGYAARIGTFVQRLFESYGLECRFVGGGAGSLSSEGDPCIITDDGVLSDAAVLATVPSPSNVGISHGWREVGGPFRVNDAAGATLSMLGDESAFDVYRRVVEADSGTTLTRENFFEVAKSYPFGISRLHEEKLVRDPFKVDGDGTITCFGEIPEGEYLHVLTGNPVSLVDAAGDATRAAARDNGAGPLAVFDCISRVLYLEEVFDDELDAIAGPGDPAFGALTIGEIANGDGGHLQFHNKTVIVARVEAL